MTQGCVSPRPPAAVLALAARAALAAIVVVVVVPAGAQAEPGAQLSFTGYARDPQSQRVLYVESHYVRGAGSAQESRVVLYRCPSPAAPGGAGAAAGAPFARKVLRYGDQREAPEFTLFDARTGYTEGLQRTAQGPRVFVQNGKAAPRREAALPANAALVSDAGFDEFVRRHWADLEAGRTLRFPFLVPSRLEFLSFRVHKHHEERIDGTSASVIRLHLSGMLGWFVPYIEVAYRKSDRQLRRYRGLTNIHDASGANVLAVIEFPDRERELAARFDLDALRAEPLVSRCSNG